MKTYRQLGSCKFIGGKFMSKEEPLLFVVQNAATMSL